MRWIWPSLWMFRFIVSIKMIVINTVTGFAIRSFQSLITFRMMEFEKGTYVLSGAIRVVRQYQAALSEVGVTLDVVLVGATKYDSISYIDYLTLQLNARCILDVGQADQRGLTLRPLEAACYEKKLISNNRFLAQEPFYDPQNILILEEEFDAKAVKHFLMSPKRLVPDEVLRQYDPGYVIDRIIEDLDNVPTNP